VRRDLADLAAALLHLSGGMSCRRLYWKLVWSVAVVCLRDWAGAPAARHA
jgi:hypothetical protein